MAFAWSDTSITTTAGADFRDFAEDTGHGVLCGVGGSGLCRTFDGSTWTAQTLAEANSMRGIAYAPTLGTAGRLCAVSSNGTSRVQTSDDGGVTWTARTASDASGWQSVVWVPWLNSGSGWFVAVASSGAGNRVMTSPDGITWTGRSAASASTWSFVAASGTTLVSVNASSGTQQAMTSTDAITWTLRTTSASAANQVGVASGSSGLVYSSTLTMFAYIAIGSGARFVNASTDNGVTWTAVSLPTSRTWTGIRWLDNSVNRFVVVSQSSTTRIASSTNGTSFTEEDTGLTNRFWDCVGWLSAQRKMVSWGQSTNTHMLLGAWASFDGLSPIFGTKRGGTVVTLTGVGFTGVTSVTFGGVAAVNVTVVNDTTITCITVARAAGALVDVTVVGIGTLTNAYTFVAVDRVSPKVGTVAGGTSVRVTGFGFATASAILFGDDAATSVVAVSNTAMTAVTPAHASGRVDVTVVGVDVGAQLYAYTLPVPQSLGKGPLLPNIPTRSRP